MSEEENYGRYKGNILNCLLGKAKGVSLHKPKKKCGVGMTRQYAVLVV